MLVVTCHLPFLGIDNEPLWNVIADDLMKKYVAEATVQSAHVDRLQARVDEIDIPVQPIDGERLNRRVIITASDDELEKALVFSSEKSNNNKTRRSQRTQH